jgi:hypothetical protein
LGVAVILPHARFLAAVVTVASLVDIAFVAYSDITADGVDLDLYYDALTAVPLTVDRRLTILFGGGRIGLLHAVAVDNCLALSLAALGVLLLGLLTLALLGLVLFDRRALDSVHAVALEDGNTILPFLVTVPQHRPAWHISQETVVLLVLAFAIGTVGVLF